MDRLGEGCTHSQNGRVTLSHFPVYCCYSTNCLHSYNPSVTWNSKKELYKGPFLWQPLPAAGFLISPWGFSHYLPLPQGKKLPANISEDAEEGEVSDEDSADEIEDDCKLLNGDVSGGQRPCLRPRGLQETPEWAPNPQDQFSAQRSFICPREREGGESENKDRR